MKKGFESKKVLGIFDVNDINSDRAKTVNVAADYLASMIGSAGENQLNYQMTGEIIEVSEKDLGRFRRVFSNYILKKTPKEGSIMLWTSNGEVFDRIGTDNYLKDIMEGCKLPITVLPSELCMYIYSHKIEVEDGYKVRVLYDVNDSKKMGL